jgi:hypothetical protein
MEVLDRTGDPETMDRVEEAAAESFPASDPPAWTPLLVGPPPRSGQDVPGGTFSYSWPAPDETENLPEVLQQLETTLSARVPAREQAGWGPALAELRAVRETLNPHTPAKDDPDGLLEGVDVTRASLVRQGIKLGREHAELLTQARMLLILSTKEAEDGPTDLGLVRRRLEHLLEALRQHQTQETELLLESDYTEVGTGD